ncbi:MULTISPECIES: type II toxin-antitoxin system YoeB family toxin [Fusobacterium]|nr:MULTISPECIES: type II toxin-antitoxin system YoeB family toxin [Fusobacterium]
MKIRIDEKNRLIYDMENDVIRVLSCKEHYEE